MSVDFRYGHRARYDHHPPSLTTIQNCFWEQHTWTCDAPHCHSRHVAALHEGEIRCIPCVITVFGHGDVIRP